MGQELGTLLHVKRLMDLGATSIAGFELPFGRVHVAATHVIGGQ